MFQHFGSEEAVSILSEGRIDHLSCMIEQGLYIVPINYIFHDGDAYISSRMGSKIRVLRKV
jgi:nitroimidazol reductase NimA-like FMN-containing flavoprotein (pyridoxamine 5'-phosphate oxidase superfamily)